MQELSIENNFTLVPSKEKKGVKGAAANMLQSILGKGYQPK